MSPEDSPAGLFLLLDGSKEVALDATAPFLSVGQPCLALSACGMVSSRLAWDGTWPGRFLGPSPSPWRRPLGHSSPPLNSFLLLALA